MFRKVRDEVMSQTQNGRSRISTAPCPAFPTSLPVVTQPWLRWPIAAPPGARWATASVCNWPLWQKAAMFVP